MISSSPAKSTGAGLRAIRFSRANWLDLQELGVVVDRTGLDRAVAAGHGLVAGASGQVGDQVLDGGPGGRAGAGEQAAVVDGVMAAGAAPAGAAGDHLAEAQQHVGEPGEFVHGLAGVLPSR
ncbi:hypothetical protein GXW82_27515 [Streptacidiphilus sp. 4-A2]|nr:hypothetical protein [Streptacidiphilus sp. 4-A2]